MGVNKLFGRGVALEPNRLCLVDAQVSRTYREVDARQRAIAAALAADGVRVGDKCAVYSPNCAAAFECILGIYRTGGVFVPLNPKNAVGDSIFVVHDCEVSVILFHSSLAADIQAIREACPGVRRYVCIDAELQHGATPGLEGWLASASGEPPEIEPDTQRLVSIYSTGGTTGKPKGVMFTPLTWETMAANMYEAMPLGKPPVYLVISPMTHAAGTIGILMMGRGATIIIHDRFNAEAVLRTIQQEQVTHLYLPPTAIYMLLGHPDVRRYDYSSLEAFIYTSAPMSTSKIKDCLEIFGPVMIQFWGQTEAPIFCTVLRQADHVLACGENDRRLASCGRPMLLTPVEVMDDHGRLLSGEKGELVVRGNLVMTGYYKNEAATREASLHGWHHSGDIGYKDEDGFVYIVDRKKDMIISGGFNVFPSEVEQVIMQLGEVQDCAVIGTPDDKWGESVTAILEMRPGSTVDPEAVQALCKRELGSVKTPKSVQIWPALPRTSVGKVDKKQIRAGFWRGVDRVI